MNPRPVIPIDPAGMPRPSARVARIAELLDCDEKQVRRLVDNGDLEGFRLGKRGLRVFLDSVADYQADGRRRPRQVVEKAPKARAVDRAAQKFAETELRKSGILA